MARTGRGELRAKTFARIRPNSPNWIVALKAALRSRFSRAILKDREIAAASKIRDVAKKRSKGVSWIILFMVYWLLVYWLLVYWCIGYV
jgi:hypothetical protein